MKQHKWMAPPWLACPGLVRAEGDYVRRHAAWLAGLTEGERAEYARLFPAPPFWGEGEPALWARTAHRARRLWRPGGGPAYGRTELERDWAAGARPEFVFFWNPDPTPEGRLSQWWPADFAVDGVTYCCMEQYMMAEKARVFGDGPILSRILASADPGEIKALGRQVAGFDGRVWDVHKYTVVLEGNFQKFLQNPELKRLLLDTGERVLTEASPYDRIWGIGLGREEPDAALPPRWLGQNLVGFALMEVRGQLRRVCAAEEQIDWALSVGPQEEDG